MSVYHYNYITCLYTINHDRVYLISSFILHYSSVIIYLFQYFAVTYLGPIIIIKSEFNITVVIYYNEPV